MSVTTEPAAAVGSMYDRIGGAPMVARIVDRLYVLILEDALLRPMFDGVDLVRVKRHMVAMLSQVLGGPRAYAGRALAEAHQALGINREQYERVGNYLIACLWIEHAPVDVTYTVGDVLTGLARDVVTAEPAASTAAAVVVPAPRRPGAPASS